jgi:hypothetical protein
VNNDRCMFIPIVLGSDKTTVSVGTGDIEYHPLYFSLSPFHNSVRQAHWNALIPIGFLAILKSKSSFLSTFTFIDPVLFVGDRKYDNDPKFRKFK